MPFSYTLLLGGGLFIFYVDAMIITGNDPDHIMPIKLHFQHRSEMKDLNSFCYFLGPEIAHSQHGYLFSLELYLWSHSSSMLGSDSYWTSLQAALLMVGHFVILLEIICLLEV